MSRGTSSSLIIGAASKLGAALVNHHSRSIGDKPRVIAAEISPNQYALTRFVSALDGVNGICVEPYHPSAPMLGMQSVLGREIDSVGRIFYVAHGRDRTQKSAVIRETNRKMIKGVIGLAKQMKNLERLVVVTDVGLSGDYRGRFSEGWIDVGQTPFDEVDRSSMEAEMRCLEESDLPITRVRVGLVSDFNVPLASTPEWTGSAKTLIPFIRVLKKMPRFLRVPVFIRRGALAPLTPAESAASVMVQLCANSKAVGCAVHLVLSPPPPLLDIMKHIAKNAGGGGIKPGLVSGYMELAERIPGLSETTKRQADQVASWWTPHRYCLSLNDLDTANLDRFVSNKGHIGEWREALAGRFFLRFD